MKILEVNIDDLNYGGVYSLLRKIIRPITNSVEIDIASIEGFQQESNKKYFESFGCNVFYIGSSKNKFIKQICVYKNLKKLLAKNHYDAVHIHADTANKLLISGLAAKRAGIKNVILHSHAIDAEGAHRQIKRIFHYACRLFLPCVGTTFIACSDLAGKWMFPDVCDVNIVINGIDLKKYKFDRKIRTDERSKLGLKDEILIGNVGRLASPKNHKYLIQIANELKKRNIDFKMIFVGEGELERELKEYAVKLNVMNNIIFYGVTDRVEDLLQAMDVFTFPSIHEGYGMSAVEAQANGLPTIISDTLLDALKLTECAHYIGIRQTDINSWCDAICLYAKMGRKDTYEVLLKQGMDISGMAEQLLKIYIS